MRRTLPSRSQPAWRRAIRLIVFGPHRRTFTTSDGKQEFFSLIVSFILHFYQFFSHFCQIMTVGIILLWLLTSRAFANTRYSSFFDPISEKDAILAWEKDSVHFFHSVHSI
jgi:hypothetical protein